LCHSQRNYESRGEGGTFRAKEHLIRGGGGQSELKTTQRAGGNFIETNQGSVQKKKNIEREYGKPTETK